MKARAVWGAAWKALLLLTATLLFLLFPARYAKSVRDGISLWAVSVLPATLPFLFLTTLLTELDLFKKVTKLFAPPARGLFRISGEGAMAGLLSMTSGYPVGAKTVSELALRGRISEEEKFRVVCLSTTSGPAFLVGVVGSGMFLSPAVGWILYLSHLLGVGLVCFLLRFTAKPVAVRPYLQEASPPVTLGEALSGSVLSVLTVGGAIAIFYAFGQMIADMGAFFSLPPLIEAVVRGLLEMTTGCALLAKMPSAFSIALCAFLVTFGGLCVLVQQLTFLSRIHIPALPFLLIKALQGAIAAGIAYGLALLLI